MISKKRQKVKCFIKIIKSSAIKTGKLNNFPVTLFVRAYSFDFVTFTANIVHNTRGYARAYGTRYDTTKTLCIAQGDTLPTLRGVGMTQLGHSAFDLGDTLAYFIGSV